jgi:hypothetical protein
VAKARRKSRLARKLKVGEKKDCNRNKDKKQTYFDFFDGGTTMLSTAS